MTGATATIAPPGCSSSSSTAARAADQRRPARAAAEAGGALAGAHLGGRGLKAAVLSSAKQAKGLDAVFRSVASSADGAWLLALLASGLVCYGLYCLLEARYRDLTPGR